MGINWINWYWNKGICSTFENIWMNDNIIFLQLGKRICYQGYSDSMKKRIELTNALIESFESASL